MENKKVNSTTTSQNGKQSKQKSATALMQSSQLMKLFQDELKDIYWVEKSLIKAIPKMIKSATSPELVDALSNHLSQTKQQVIRVEQVFEVIGKKAATKTCLAMEGILDESEEIMDECEKGAMCDAGIISAAQKIEHYEIASYGTLRQFAETLGLHDAAGILQTTLDEEKAADDKLTEVATMAINIDAAKEDI